MGRIGGLVEELLRELEHFDPGELAGGDCARLVASFARVEKALAGARARAAVRATDCGAHREQGFSDASEWLARETGNSTRGARCELETTKALDACPETRDALMLGLVSFAQASEIVRTVAEVPGVEEELLGLAKNASLSRLRAEGRRQRSRAVPAEQLHARQRAVREVAHWRDELGMVCCRMRLTPDIGVPFVNRLERDADRARREAKHEGNAERWEAHAADAFAAMISAASDPNAAKSKSRSVDVVIVCNVNAWRRGHAHPGEECHIVGGGPIPAALAREMSQDAFLKAVLHDGVNIHTVAHFGRRVPAELRTALDLGPMPELDGIACTEEGCDRRYDLEWDHVDPVANGGLTSFENMKPRCKRDHWDKTERDRQAGLLNPTKNPTRPPP